MRYVDRVLKTDAQYERLNDLQTYVFYINMALDLSVEFFPRHVQQLETLLREAVAAKDAALDELARN